MDRKSLTPRERMIILALKHANTSLSLNQLMHETGFKSPQAFKISLRFLVTAGIVNESENASGEPVYGSAPKKAGT